MMEFGLPLVFRPWYCPPWFYGADKLFRPLDDLIHPQCQGLWSFCCKRINEVVTHDSDEYIPVNLILILVAFVFPFLADLLVHVLFKDHEHGGGEYGRPEVLLEGILCFPGEVFQLESVLQEQVGAFDAPTHEVHLLEILSLVLCVIGDQGLDLA